MIQEKIKEQRMSRRSLLFAAAMASTFEMLAKETLHAEPMYTSPVRQEGERLKIAIFSKHLQFMNVPDMAAAAKAMGFDAIDLTVRSGGHVLPENVATDLPRAVHAIRKVGLDVSMITTEITADTLRQAEMILGTASKLGIHHYRWGGMKYDAMQPIPSQIEAMKPKMKALAEVNHRTRCCGMYHTHSGPDLVGACIWDLWYMFRDLDPQWMGVNYDIGHATVEGGYGGWIATSKLTRGLMRGIAIKDFLWARNEKGSTHNDPYDKSLGVAGAYVPHWCPIDHGMVHLNGFFEIIKADGFTGPVQLHFEYPLGGAENGKGTLTWPREKVFETMSTDLKAVRTHMEKLGLA